MGIYHTHTHARTHLHTIINPVPHHTCYTLAQREKFHCDRIISVNSIETMMWYISVALLLTAVCILMVDSVMLWNLLQCQLTCLVQASAEHLLTVVPLSWVEVAPSW